MLHEQYCWIIWNFEVTLTELETCSFPYLFRYFHQLIDSCEKKNITHRSVLALCTWRLVGYVDSNFCAGKIRKHRNEEQGRTCAHCTIVKYMFRFNFKSFATIILYHNGMILKKKKINEISVIRQHQNLPDKNPPVGIPSLDKGISFRKFTIQNFVLLCHI